MSEELFRSSLENQLPAVLARARAKVDHVVGGANGLLVVLDDNDCVPEVAQVRERLQQLAVVALVQADRRLVQDIEHAGEIGANLGGEADALPFTAGKGCRASVQREIADTDVVQEAEPVLNLPQHARGDERLALGELEGLEHVTRGADGQVDVLRHRRDP